MTLQQSGGDYQLSLMDEAVIRYHAKGLDFIGVLDQYLNFLPPYERYVFSTPEVLLLVERAHDEEHGHFWYIMYAASRSGCGMIADFMKFAPYKLDTVAFARYRSMMLGEPDKLKYHKWDNLKRIVNYGRKQIITTTTSTPSPTSSSTTASSPCSSVG